MRPSWWPMHAPVLDGRALPRRLGVLHHDRRGGQHWQDVPPELTHLDDGKAQNRIARSELEHCWQM